jgi:hypothetical protein
MEVLGHFRAGDEIIGAFERRPIGLEAWIVESHGMTRPS